MAGPYGERIREALFLQEASESVERVKELVASVLRESDPQVKVHKTHYFNHTFSPDLVLEWPQQAKEEPRRVFLRATQHPRVMVDDIELVGDLKPIFVHLDELSSFESERGSDLPRNEAAVNYAAEDDTAVLRERALGSRSLVTEVASLEQFNEARQTSAGAGLFTSSLVRGGQGLVEQESADLMSQVVTDGFLGAQAVDLESTTAVVEMIEGVLDLPESHRLTSVLQAVWVGSGGHAYDFPSTSRELVPQLDADALRFLLTAQDLDDVDFWARLGRSIEMQTLTALGSMAETPALQSLMRAALPRLRAKSCVVRRDRGRLDVNDEEYRWSIDEHALSLRGHNVQAWLADRLEDIKVAELQARPPEIAILRRRAQSASIKIFEFEATNDAETLRFASESETDVIDRDDAFVAEALGETAGVKRAATVLTTGHTLDINFVASSARGRTSSKPTMTEVLWTSVNLLADLTSRARDELGRAVDRWEAPEEDGGTE